MNRRLNKRVFPANTLFSDMIGKAADRSILLFLMAALTVFIFYPLFCLSLKSILIDGRLTLQEYENLFTKNAIPLKHSLFTASLSAVFSTILGILVAMKLSVSRGKRKLFYRAILLMTMVSPPFISSLFYIQLFGRRGWITWRLLGLSINPYNKWGIIAMQSIHFTSLNALFMTGIMEKLDHRMIHAARDLGASSTAAFFQIIVPMLRPAMWGCLILSFVRSLSDFGTPAVIGGRYSTLASEIYMQLIGYAKTEKAAAMNMLLFIPAVLAFISYRFLMKQSDRMLASENGRTGGEFPIRFKGILNLFMNLGVWLFYGMMLLQYFCIFITGFLKSRKGVYSFSLEHVEKIAEFHKSSILRSVEYSFFVAIFGTLFGLLLSYYLERRKVAGKWGWDFLASLPYLLPGTCFGLGYIMAFNRGLLKLTGTAAIIVLNMAFKQLPAITKIGSASLAQIHRRLEDAARDLGAGRLSVIRDVILPNLKTAFVTGFIYNFASSMTTAGSVLFLISARHKVAVYTLFDAINSGEYGVASLISSIIIVITIAVSGGISLLFSEKGEKGSRRKRNQIWGKERVHVSGNQ